MLVDEVRALAIVPSLAGRNRKPLPGGRDQALKPRRLLTVAEKAVHEARQNICTRYKCDEMRHGVRQFPLQALDAMEAKAIKKDEIDDDDAQAAMYAAKYALMATEYVLFAPKLSSTPPRPSRSSRIVTSSPTLFRVSRSI